MKIKKANVFCESCNRIGDGLSLILKSNSLNICYECLKKNLPKQETIEESKSKPRKIIWD